ncbi:MAG: DEAD/DEAH box helicase [Methanobacteriaceae archaeon]|nr:DEAD/DEAH box helicase [Methanobacteriaceae archaeon]
MIILRKKKNILELYPIGSAKGALNSRRKPLFYGYIKLKNVNGRIKIHRFHVKKDDKEAVFPPSEAAKILKNQTVFLLGSDSQTEELLNEMNINYKRTLICNHCIMDGYITIIKRDSSYQFHNDHICRICAEQEVKRELNYRDFDLSTFKNFKRILDSTYDVNKVLSVLNPNFDPVKNSDLTLYDKIEVKGNKKPKMAIAQLNIPEKFKDIIKSNGKYLLPVQQMAMEKGLLDGENLLVVSATASGKTLIGEIAGVSRAMNKKKFLFLTPLVALANQKYRDFKSRYSKLDLNVSIKVGMSRIKAKEEISLGDDEVKDSDIVVGTYEGIDFQLRSGRANDLKDLGVVVIDEIHMLDDPERGPRLNGLIQRLKSLFKNLQIIGLSATVKNPKEIATEFGMKLVEYGERPVPLERHLIFTRSEYDKLDIMVRIARSEYKNISKKGFRGQTIIFTNSRRKTHSISDYLTKRGVSAAAYHAGLSYSKKNNIEKDYLKQKISTVVTTAALAAGVDFPASQVIFESITMGNKWLSPNEFSQMLGRAGRPTYHDIGKVYLLPEIGRIFEDEAEEAVAIDLLDSDVEEVDVHYSEDDVIEQVLADICTGNVRNITDLKKTYKSTDLPLNLDTAIDLLIDYKLITENGNFNVTSYGRAVSTSFLNQEDAEYIRKNLKKITPSEMALTLEPFENVYLSNRVHKKLSKVLKVNLSTRLFADSTLDIISSAENISKLDPALQDALINLQMEFLSCKCKDRPFCTCFQMELSRRIIKYRSQNKDPVDISKILLKNYQIHAYAGDIFSWMDNLIRKLEAIRRIARAFKYYKIVKQTSKLIKTIEKGY